MTTIDDQNPLISYQPREAWIQHDVTTDAIAAKYDSIPDEIHEITKNTACMGRLLHKHDNRMLRCLSTLMGMAINILGSTNGSFIANIDGKDYPGSVAADKNGTQSLVIVDDVEPAFHFEQGMWSTSSADSQNFFQGMGQYIEIDDSVSLFGSTGPDHGHYSVQLDDQPSQTFQAKQMTPAVQVMIL
ncbi:hypothetical protein C0995_008152 [Termitomyces sp. Mi166|nr:hypothetical protein C0995_008152 [Termitomyces sp. Mi166\